MRLYIFANRELGALAHESGYSLRSDLTHINFPESSWLIPISLPINSVLMSTAGALVGTFLIGSSGPILAVAAGGGVLAGVTAGVLGKGGADLAIVGGVAGSGISAAVFEKGGGVFKSLILGGLGGALGSFVVITVASAGAGVAPFFLSNALDEHFIYKMSFVGHYRAELHYVLEDENGLALEGEGSCIYFFSTNDAVLDLEIDTCLHDEIFPQEVEGQMRVGTAVGYWDRRFDQTLVVATDSIDLSDDSINLRE